LRVSCRTCLTWCVSARAVLRSLAMCTVLLYPASVTDPHDDAQLLANSTEGFIAGNDTSLTLVSPGFMNIMGYDDKEELLRCARFCRGQCVDSTPPRQRQLTLTRPRAMCRTPVHDIIYPEDRPQVMSKWQAAQAESVAAGGRAIPTSFICRHRRKDGSYVWVESMSCITPTHFYGLIRDINDRKALEVRACRGSADTAHA
jgi:PAS domain-containing protein